MAQLLEWTSEKEELSYLHARAQAQHNWALVELCKSNLPGGACHDLLRNTVQRLADENLWANCGQVEATQTNIVRFSLRCAATIYELICKQLCSSFPLRIFSLLYDRSLAEEIVALSQSHPCLFDEWTLQHVLEHNSVERLLSDQSLNCLSAVAGLCVGNCYGIERLHSKHARKSRSRVHTHTMPIEQLAMYQQVSSTPAWLQACCAEDMPRINVTVAVCISFVPIPVRPQHTLLRHQMRQFKVNH